MINLFADQFSLTGVRIEFHKREQMKRRLLSALVLISCAIGVSVLSKELPPQESDRLTPIQREIEHERQCLASSDVEERRDALMKLGSLKRPDASRAAKAGLNDAVPIVRATSVHAIVSLPQAEAEVLLIPLLQDKSEFVRRETAYALGEIGSHSAVGPLSNTLSYDKEAAVRAAAAVALGEIRDEAAVNVLSQVLNGNPPAKGKNKSKPDEFVMRAAAHSLGQIRSKAGVPVLIAALENDTNPGDVRREAATSLGLIGDVSAVASLRAAVGSADPYLSAAARDSLRRMRIAKD